MDKQQNHPQPKSTLLLTCVLRVCAYAILVPSAITFFQSGKSATEKLITGMIHPLFIMLIVAIAIGHYLVHRGDRTAGYSLLAISFIVWISGTPALVGYLFSKWESQVPPTEVREPFDFIVVLGGGTFASPTGRPQFGDGGDRVGYAAQLYLQGKTKHLVTTGDVIIASKAVTQKFRKEDDPSYQTQQIWIGLGIPENAIHEIAGENTSKEMESLSKHPEWWTEKPCGLITSAFHMPRALRLAQARGIRVVGIPVDYRSAQGPFMFNDLFPASREHHRLQLLLKECLASLFGR